MLTITDIIDYGILGYLLEFFEKHEINSLKVNKKLLIYILI
jgi:hypothetical protein